MRYTSAFYVCLLCALSASAFAQIPVPKQDVSPEASTSSAPVAGPAAQATSVPDFDADGKKASGDGDYVDPQGVKREAYGNVKLTPEAMAATEKMQAESRAEEAMMGGFKWMAWDKAGPKVWDFVFKRSPSLKADMDKGLNKFVDIAVADVDHDGKPDIIMWTWVDCVTDGCLYTVYFGNEVKQPENYVARTFRPYAQGVMVDNGYFKL